MHAGVPPLPHLLLDIIPAKVRDRGGLTSASSQTPTSLFLTPPPCQDWREVMQKMMGQDKDGEIAFHPITIIGKT